MLSTTGLTTFLANRNSIGAGLHAIVKLTDGTSTWYLSDTEMELSDGHVYGILTGMSGIQSQADPITKEWSVGDVTLEFSNLPYRDTTTGRNMRLSDEIGSILRKDVYIYLMAGPCTAISQCLLRFYGQVEEIQPYTSAAISIRCIDKSQVYNKTIPTTYYRGITDDASPEVMDTPVPIVYGVFDFDIWNPKVGTGLMKGYPLTEAKHPAFQFAIHALEALTDVYYREGDEVLQWENHTDDLATAQSTLDDKYVWTFMALFEHGSGLYGFVDSTQTNEAAGVDGSASTLTGIRDVYDNGSERRCQASYLFSDNQESIFSRAISSQSARDDNANIEVIYKVNELVTHNMERSFYLYHANAAGPGAPVFSILFSTLTWDGTERTVTGAVGSATAAGKSDQYCFQLYGVTSAAGADNTVNNQTLANLYRIGLRAKWNFKPAILGEDPPENEAWATGQGKAFGSWIDNAGRSNSYAAGDLIDTIAGVIESILRDYCGVTTALIDEASFDTGMNTVTYLGADPYMQILERRPAFEYIKQLVEQFHMLFTWTANSKAKLVSLSYSLSADRIIPFSHIKNGEISVSRLAPFANDMTAKSRWLEFFGEFIDSDADDNTTSQTAYGVQSYEAEWPNIVDTQVTGLMGQLMGTSGSTGLWSQPHHVIDFETVGFTNADLEVGDRIELDSATVDGQVKLFGATWATKVFMVTSVEQTLDGTKISAMQL